jgi:hypothetical protein
MAERPISYNPFLEPPPANDLRSRMARIVEDAVSSPRATALVQPRVSASGRRGPLISLEDRISLANAPKLDGTRVSVKAYPVGPSFDPFQHMYAEFDDGRDSYIYRGGPDPDARVGAGVAPAHLSRDFAKGERVLYETFLPGVPAREAIKPAQADADRINRSGDPYLGVTSNSNSVIGGYTDRQFGHRVGDAWTPGYRYDLPDHPEIPPGVDPVPPGVYRATTPIW